MKKWESLASPSVQNREISCFPIPVGKNALMQRMHNRYAQPLDSQNLRAARGSARSPRVSEAPQKEPRNLGALVIQSSASDIDEPEVPLHSPHQ